MVGLKTYMKLCTQGTHYLYKLLYLGQSLKHVIKNDKNHQNVILKLHAYQVALKKKAAMFHTYLLKSADCYEPGVTRKN